MLKHSLVALTAAILGASALAAPAFKCEPPVIQVADVKDATVAQYSIDCVGDSKLALTPSVMFSGEVHAHGTPPYVVKATYHIDTRSLYDQKLNMTGREDQLVSGTILTSTVSIAALPTQFAAKTDWDAMSGALSVEEQPGLWRIYGTVLDGAAGASITDAGVASTPLKDGRTSTKVVFGPELSRFAGKGVDLSVINAKLGLRDGKLELLMGETRVANQPAMQGALLQLDKRPKDMPRAWALASRAKFLGLEDEVRYAEQKVAAHNPQLLEAFQTGLARIQPFELAK